MTLNAIKKIPVYIKCGEDGKKQPIYPEDWQNPEREYTQKEKNRANAFAALTGESNGITVIDVDNEEALRQLEAKGKISLFNEAGLVVKTKKGWHFYFLYEKGVSTCTRFLGIRGVDIRNDGGNVFIWTDASVDCASYDIIKSESLTPFPDRLLFNTESGIVQREEKVVGLGEPLAPLLHELLKASPFHGKLRGLNEAGKKALRRLTPKYFRDPIQSPHYAKIFDEKGYIEPNDIEDGDGHEYLKRVRGILMSDETVDRNLYENTLRFLNEAWERPMDSTKLYREIISFDDNSLWNYDEGWEEKAEARSQIAQLEAAGVELYITYSGRPFYREIKSGRIEYPTKTDFEQVLFRSITGSDKPFSAKNWQYVQRAEVKFDPRQSGKFEDEEGRLCLNTFRKTVFMELFTRQEKPKREPELILALIRNLIPDKRIREQFIHWIAYFLATFSRSTVTYVLSSVPGAGKNLFFDHVITPIFGRNQTYTAGQKDIENDFNGWITNSGSGGLLFVAFNEISSTYREKKQAHNRLKSYITDEYISVRAMRADAVNVRVFFNTLFFSNDEAPVEIEQNDRRYNVIRTETKLEEVPEFRELVGTPDLVRRIAEELPDFVRYLSQIPLDSRKYNKVIDTKDRTEAILETLPFLEQILVLIRLRRFDELADVLHLEEIEKARLFAHVNDEEPIIEQAMLYDKVVNILTTAYGRPANLTKHRFTKKFAQVVWAGKASDKIRIQKRIGEKIVSYYPLPPRSEE